MKLIGAWCVLLVLCSAAHSQTPTPPAPVRPTSDSSKAAQDEMGTNYLRVNQSSTLDLVRLMQESQPSVATTHPVAPTSDKVNVSTNSEFRAMLEEMDPALVRAGDDEAYTNYAVVRPNVDPQRYNVINPSGTLPPKILQVYKVSAGGGSGVIAIVDAFHYPNAASDLAKFSTALTTSAYPLQVLPPCPQVNPFAGSVPCLRVEAKATAPVNCGWNVESALDLEWAHAIAPKASILFVEAASNSASDLYAAVATARDEIATLHGQVSISWGSPNETAQGAGFSSTFTDGVLYFAATGDSRGQVGFPATFPNVVAVGGTVLQWSGGVLAAESGWPSGGGGVSAIETPAPPYQVGVVTNASGRNTPDIAAVSDANPAVPVFASTPVAQCVDIPAPDQYLPGWMQVTGTSLSTPIVAAMANVAGRNRATVLGELEAIYANRKNPLRIRDIKLVSGAAGANSTQTGYDNVIGVGAPASLDFDAVPPTP